MLNTEQDAKNLLAEAIKYQGDIHNLNQLKNYALSKGFTKIDIRTRIHKTLSATSERLTCTRQGKNPCVIIYMITIIHKLNYRINAMKINGVHISWHSSL